MNHFTAFSKHLICISRFSNSSQWITILILIVLLLRPGRDLKSQTIAIAPDLQFISQFPCGDGTTVRGGELEEDQLGRIWMIGKDDSSNRALYSFDGLIWTSYPIPYNFWDFRELAIDQAGNKWIGTRKHGIIKFNGTAFELFDSTNSALACNAVHEVRTDILGNIWVLQVCPPSVMLTRINGSVWETFGEAQTGFDKCEKFTLIADNLGAVYFTTHKNTCALTNKLVRFDGLTSTVYSGWADHLTEITSGADGKIYGVFRHNNDGKAIKEIGVFEAGQWTYYNPPPGASGVLDRAMTGNDLVFSQEKLWMMNHQKRQFYSFSFNDSIFTVYTTATNLDRYYTFTVDNNGKIWLVDKLNGEVMIANTMAYGFFTGTVFSDENGNGIFDSNESGMVNRIVKLMPDEVYATTDYQGHYELGIYDTLIPHEIEFTIPPYSYLTTSTAVYSIPPTAQSVGDLDFGIQTDTTIQDLAVSLYTAIPIPGFDRFFTCTSTNIAFKPMSDTLKVLLDPHYINITGINPAPLSVSTNEIRWLYSLPPGDNAVFTFQATVDPATVISSQLVSTATIAPLASDSTPADNVYQLVQEVVGSFDPNEKNSETPVPFTGGNSITYTITFQNTGTAAASFVIIRDTLSGNLDPATIQLLGYSHPVTWNVSGAGYLEFNFANINLPASTADEAGSHGFVTFSIQSKAGLLPGEVITNDAAIYFDYNSPVITNETMDVISLPTVSPAIIASLVKVMVYPNPAEDYVTVRTSLEGRMHISVRDALGRIVFDKRGMMNPSRISMDEWATGLYLVTVVQDNEIRGAGKILKQ